MNQRLQIICGDALTELRKLEDNSVHCCVTSPPYWGLRDYGVAGQLGLERTPENYVAKMVEVFREVRRVLRSDGTCWVNMGDSYAGPKGNNRGDGAGGGQHRGQTIFGSAIGGSHTPEGLKPKDLCGIPWMMAFTLRADGWYLRQDIIWHKPNPMPESVTDRCTKAHEYIFLLSKSGRYFFDAEAIREPVVLTTLTDPRGNDNGHRRERGYPGNASNGGTRLGEGSMRNKRSVWTVPSAPYSEAHFATFPPNVIKPCILAGTSATGCCPECGAQWERVLKRSEPHGRTANDGKGYVLPKGKEGINQSGSWQRASGSMPPNMRCDITTTGWHPSCDCQLNDAEPCTVLDPFAGSGTTGMVSLELGRKAILIELNPKYIELAKERCHVTPGLPIA